MTTWDMLTIVCLAFALTFALFVLMMAAAAIVERVVLWIGEWREERKRWK